MSAQVQDLIAELSPRVDGDLRDDLYSIAVAPTLMIDVKFV